MYEPVTICAPVWNEQDTIIPTLNSVLDQDYPGELEIIVCANGCTDSTADRVREAQEFWPNIRLIEVEEQGKPNAWNICREEASHNYVVFIDGDVLLYPDAVSTLVKRLDQDPELTAVAALPVPTREHHDYITKLLSPGYKIPSCLIGRLYGFRNDAVQNILEESEHAPNARMPKDIIHEDAWITVVVGKDNWAPVPEAKVAYTPYHWKEYVRLDVRHIRAGVQLVDIFGPRYQTEFLSAPYIDETFTQRTIRRVRNLCCNYSVGQSVEVVAGFFLRRTAKCIARMIAERENGKELTLQEAWEAAPTSKIPMTSLRYVE